MIFEVILLALINLLEIFFIIITTPFRIFDAVAGTLVVSISDALGWATEAVGILASFVYYNPPLLYPFELGRYGLIVVVVFAIIRLIMRVVRG